MPLINGRFYMNPTLGTALERARAADGEPGAESAAGDSSAPPRDGQGRFAPAGPVHHVHIEVGDGGFVARIQRAPIHSGSPQPGLPPQPTSHVFTDHNDLVEFLRNELGS